MLDGVTGHPNPQGPISGDEFSEAMGPGIQALAGLANTFTSMNEEHGYIASASSRAMAEIAQEERFASEASPEPAHNAHAMAGMLNRAGVDHAASYAHLFSSAPIPTYAHLVVARAALEAFAWGYWLADPRIGVEQRIKRSKVWQLVDAQQLRRLGPPGREQAKEIKARVRRGVPDGWSIVSNDRTISVAGETQPTTRQAISAVLRIDPNANPASLGGALWSYLSGVIHASQYALLASMELDAEAGESTLGPLIVATVTRGDRAHFIAATICRAAINACDAEVTLLGWDHDLAWQTAVNDADSYIKAVLQAAPRS